MAGPAGPRTAYQSLSGMLPVSRRPDPPGSRRANARRLLETQWPPSKAVWCGGGHRFHHRPREAIP
eukprot:4706109-Lingulodinium_polyedra.AAC.1